MVLEIPEDSKDQIALIRKIVKKRCPTLHVRNGRGTAWGWVEVSGSLEFEEFTEDEKRALDSLGMSYGLNFAVIAPEDRRSWIEYWLRRSG